MQIPNIEPDRQLPEQDAATVLPPAHPWLEEWAKGLEFNKKIAKAMLAAGGGGVLGALQSLQALAFLDRPAKTIENYAYDVKPKPAEGFGRLNQALAPENVELGLMAPIPPAGKIVTAATAGLKAAPVVGKFAAPLMAGIAKGAEPIINALTKVPEGVDAMAALKNLAHSHVTVADFNEAHPAIAALGPEDKKMVVNMQKNFVDKYNLWGAPEGQAAYFSAGGHDPTHISWEEYPPGWADEMLKKFESLQHVEPLPGWAMQGEKLQHLSVPKSLSAQEIQEGWQHVPQSSELLNSDKLGVYAEQANGTKLEKVADGHWQIQESGKPPLNFNNVSEAKQYFAEMQGAKQAPATATSQFTAAEMKPVPVGTTPVPHPSGPLSGWTMEKGLFKPPPLADPQDWMKHYEGWGQGQTGTNVGDVYTTHDTGAKLLNIEKGWGLEFPDGTKVGPFTDIADAKHYFHDAHSAGMVAPAAGGKPAGAGGDWIQQFSPMSGEENLIHEPTGMQIGPGNAGAFLVLDEHGVELGEFSTLAEAKKAVEDTLGPGMIAGHSPAQGAGGQPVPSASGFGYDVPHPDLWEPTGSIQPGNSLFENKYTGVSIVQDPQTSLFHPTDQQGLKYGSGFGTPKEAGEAYDNMFGHNAYPPHMQGLGTPAGGWQDTPGHLGEHASHPSGLTIEKHPDTGNFHIKGSDGIMIDWESSMDAAKQTANMHHIQNVPSAIAGQPPAHFSPTLATSHLSGTHVPGAVPESIDNWNQIGPQMGSNAGGKYTAPDGQTYYVKYPADEDMTRNEMLGLMLYKAMGIHTPDVRLVEKGGRLGIASKWVEGIQTSGHADELAAAVGAKEGFAADAWLANWDVVGMQRDNMLLDAGKALRADAGGSVLYRGLQGPKGARFGKLVDELDTLRNGRNRFTSPVFKDMTDAEVRESAKKVADMHPDQIRMLVELHGPGDDVAKSALADTLIARRADILKRTGLDDPHAASMNAVQELENVYHVTPDELQMVMKYEPNLTAEAFLKRYHEAEEQFVTHLGLTPEQYRDPVQRGRAAGVLSRQSGEPINLARGSERLNPIPEAPIQMPDSNYRKFNNSTGWGHPYLFGAEYDPVTNVGSRYHKSSTNQIEELRALTSEDKVFRPDVIQRNKNSLQALAFEQMYDELKRQETAGRTFQREYHPVPKYGTGNIFPTHVSGKEVVDRWRNSGHSAGYTFAEQPDVALTLEALGYKAITTHESGGTNYAMHHTVPLRWHKAPMDPRKNAMQGYFYGGGGAAGSGLAAYLAAQALQGQQPEPEQ